MIKKYAKICQKLALQEISVSKGFAKIRDDQDTIRAICGQMKTYDPLCHCTYLIKENNRRVSINIRRIEGLDTRLISSAYLEEIYSAQYVKIQKLIRQNVLWCGLSKEEHIGKYQLGDRGTVRGMEGCFERC